VERRTGPSLGPACKRAGVRSLRPAAGYDVTAFDVDETALAAAREAGAAAAEDPAALADAVDGVVISVPGDPYVEAVMESVDGVLAGIDGDGGADLVVVSGRPARTWRRSTPGSVASTASATSTRR